MFDLLQNTDKVLHRSGFLSPHLFGFCRVWWQIVAVSFFYHPRVLHTHTSISTPKSCCDIMMECQVLLANFCLHASMQERQRGWILNSQLMISVCVCLGVCVCVNDMCFLCELDWVFLCVFFFRVTLWRFPSRVAANIHPERFGEEWYFNKRSSSLVNLPPPCRRFTPQPERLLLCTLTKTQPEAVQGVCISAAGMSNRRKCSVVCFADWMWSMRHHGRNDDFSVWFHQTLKHSSAEQFKRREVTSTNSYHQLVPLAVLQRPTKEAWKFNR